MKIFSIAVAGLILAFACNNPKNKTIEQEGVDTSQSVTDTLQPIDDDPQKTIDTNVVIDNPKTGDNASNKSGTSIEWSKLAVGKQSRMEKKSMMVVTNKTKFDELWTVAFAGDMAPEKPQIDFTKNSVVVLFLGEMTSGGHSIELLSIKQSATGGYLINVQHTKPGANCIRTMAMEYPYYFALTNKITSENAEFKMSTREIKCE